MNTDVKYTINREAFAEGGQCLLWSCFHLHLGVPNAKPAQHSRCPGRLQLHSTGACGCDAGGITCAVVTEIVRCPGGPHCLRWSDGF